MKKLGTLVSLSVIVVLFTGSAAHASAGSPVDGSITAEAGPAAGPMRAPTTPRPIP